MKRDEAPTREGRGGIPRLLLPSSHHLISKGSERHLKQELWEQPAEVSQCRVMQSRAAEAQIMDLRANSTAESCNWGLNCLPALAPVNTQSALESNRAVVSSAFLNAYIRRLFTVHSSAKWLTCPHPARINSQYTAHLPSQE